MTTNPYDPTPYDAGSSHAADTGTSSKTDVAAEQGKAEARIRQLEDLLRRAEVGEQREDDGLVEPGMIQTIRFAGDYYTETILHCTR